MRIAFEVTRVSASLATVLSVAVLSLAMLISTSVSATAEEATKKSESVSVMGKGQMEVPAEFKRTKPGSNIVQHEFQVGDDDKSARLTMMAAGGGVDANIKRWKGQFSGGDEADQKVEKMKVGEWDFHLVDVSGAFAERVGGGPFFGGKTVQREDYAMTGAILVAPDGGQFFVKMTGPAETVKANRKKFVAMIKSLEK